MAKLSRQSKKKKKKKQQQQQRRKTESEAPKLCSEKSDDGLVDTPSSKKKSKKERQSTQSSTEDGGPSRTPRHKGESNDSGTRLDNVTSPRGRLDRSDETLPLAERGGRDTQVRDDDGPDNDSDDDNNDNLDNDGESLSGKYALLKKSETRPKINKKKEAGSAVDHDHKDEEDREENHSDEELVDVDDGKLVRQSSNEDNPDDADQNLDGIENDHHDDDDDDEEEQDDDDDKEDEDGNYNFDKDELDDSVPSAKRKKVHKLDLTATENFNEKLKRRGVLYMSRIPPRMGPSKVKQLLSVHGSVTRVYLVQEDKSAAKRRKKAGGRGGKRYVEGWIELEHKKVAKRVALALNNTRITNYKRSVHYDDLWNLKYLRKFKWSHLTEKIAYERRVREQKLRVEMMQARKESALYQALVEKGQMIDKIEQRRIRARKRANDNDNDDESSSKRARMTEAELDKFRPPLPQIRQTKPVDDDEEGGRKALLGALV